MPETIVIAALNEQYRCELCNAIDVTTSRKHRYGYWPVPVCRWCARRKHS